MNRPPKRGDRVQIVRKDYSWCSPVMDKYIGHSAIYRGNAQVTFENDGIEQFQNNEGHWSFQPESMERYDGEEV